MRLKIGIDARELESNPRGVGRVLTGLLKEWNKDNRGHQFVLYFKNAVPGMEILDRPHYEKKVVAVPSPIRRNRVWEQIFLPAQIRRDRLDVFFSPSYTLPLAARCPAVVAVHDISYETHPEWFGLRQRLTLRWFARWSALRAARIVCCSNFTREEILRHYGSRLKDKVNVVYYAPDERLETAQTGPAAFDRIASKYKIKRPYFLFVGSLLRRRNVPALLRAFQKAAAKLPHHLVLIGNDDELRGELQPLTRALGLQERVERLDYVTEEDLAVFYRSAFCLVHPSSYEGFALPIVEAMACGTPTIVADAQAMTEIADGAARVVAPFNEDGLAEAMTEIAENPKLREDLIEKGLARARKLSWAQTANAYMDILEESALAGRKGFTGLSAS